MFTTIRFPALPVNHSAFHVIDTHQKAYLLGFLLADGCVMLPRPGICRSVVNLKILAGDISACHMAQEVAGGNLRLMENGYRVIWECNSDEMVADLITLGITPRKTFTAVLRWDLIPAHLHGAVLAGLIDGDGNLRFSKTARRAEVSIASGSTPLRNQLLERFPFFRSVDIIVGGNRKSTLHRISVDNNRERLQALLQTVYASLPFRVLERKQRVVDALWGYLADLDSYDQKMGNVAAMKASGLTHADIASQLGTSLRPINDRLKAQGIDSRRIIFTEDDHQEMQRLHGQGVTIAQIHREIGKGTEQAVRHHLHRMGCTQKREQPKLRHPMTDMILALHCDGQTLYGISKKIGVGVVVVSRVLRQEGIVLVKGSPMKLTLEGIDWAIAELRKGRTLNAVSKDLACSAMFSSMRVMQVPPLICEIGLEALPSIVLAAQESQQV